MYGDLANKLILEAKRSKNLEILPLYKEETIRSIVKETKTLQNQLDNLDAGNNNNTLESTQDDVNKNVQIFVNHLIMRRNKRVLLAYQRQRADKLDKITWDNVEPQGELLENLNFAESEYLEKYNELVTNYKNEIPDIDLSGSLDPPSDVFIDVRVLKDAGEIQTEYGVFNLTKDSQFFVRHSDVERLILQGYLKKL
ncbi:DNA replication protein [Saccharomycopsis crataegensis]|uniref:DNA replication complex GINS protein PSF1 n=1 Tax=Saccharomycopsis crataegensis TaxID=43959 RepID=A0AAV5QCS4_9ASCO|nr:DNA replication protein [Saccharomycopsis crataegensis]